MPPERIDPSYYSPDILEFIGLLYRYGVRYVVVGGEAVIHYGHARLTGDIDFFYEPSPENAAALFQALHTFRDGNIPGLQTADELREQGLIIQFGRPPNRIDLLNQIDGVTFEGAWAARTTVILIAGESEVPMNFIGLEELIRNKETAARPKDLDDLAYLRKRLSS